MASRAGPQCPNVCLLIHHTLSARLLTHTVRPKSSQTPKTMCAKRGSRPSTPLPCRRRCVEALGNGAITTTDRTQSLTPTSKPKARILSLCQTKGVEQAREVPEPTASPSHAHNPVTVWKSVATFDAVIGRTHIHEESRRHEASWVSTLTADRREHDTRYQHKSNPSSVQVSDRTQGRS